MVTQLVILANSFRSAHRCIAGKIVTPGRGKYEIKEWIRLAHPDTDTGAVPLESTVCDDGSFASVLNIVEVKLLQKANDPNHPEDWFFDPRHKWRKIRSVGEKALSRLADQPDELWKQGRDARAVPAGYVAGMQQPASIYLVAALRDWRVFYWKEQVASPDHPGALLEKTRRRMNFRYNGAFHEFEVTDPEFLKRYSLFENAKLDEFQEVPVS